MDSNELTVFIISLICAIICGLIAIRSIFYKGKIPDYRKADHTKSSYKLPKRKNKKLKSAKKAKALAEKEALLDEFGKKKEPKLPKSREEKWEWD